MGASFDAALGALDLSDAVAAAGAGSLAAAHGVFSVVEVVTDVPDDIRTAGGALMCASVLTVAEGRAHLGAGSYRDGGRHGDHRAGATREALAMARGELDPAEAPAAGVCVCR